MEAYNRNIATTLWLLRTLFTAVCLSGFFLIKNSHADYAFVLFFLLLCGAIVPVTSVTTSTGVLQIKQFYFYGIFYRTWRFTKSDWVRLEPFDLVMSDSRAVHTDEWYDVFWTAVPEKEITINKFVLKYYNSSAQLKRIKLTLRADEIEALKINFPSETISER